MKAETLLGTKFIGILLTIATIVTVSSMSHDRDALKGNIISGLILLLCLFLFTGIALLQNSRAKFIKLEKDI